MANITIPGMAAKPTPTVGDLVEIADMAAGGAAKKVALGDHPLSTAATTALAGKAAATHVHSGADIASGTVPVARIGTGTKDATTYYRGDGTFAVPPGTGGGGAGLAGVNTPQAVAYAATITPALASGDIVKVGALTGPLTVAAPTGYAAGRATLTLILTQDATGGRAITFNAIYLGVPTLQTTPNLTTVLTFVSDGTSWLLRSLTTFAGSGVSAPDLALTASGATTAQAG